MRQRQSKPLALGLAAILALALASRWYGRPLPLQLALSGLALALASALLGAAIEDRALRSGARAGRLLDAFLGSAAELMVIGFALAAGLRELVKASITGAILSHLLLVLGLAALLGGLRHGRQYFDRERASHAATLMVLSVIALGVPALYGQLGQARNSGPVETLSEAVAAVMIGIFALSVYYEFVYLEDLERSMPAPGLVSAGGRAGRGAGLLQVASLGLALLATAASAFLLTSAIGTGFAGQAGRQRLLGVLLVPLVCNVAAHVGTLRAAWRNRMDIALDTATGASMRVALWVAPLAVFVSLLVGQPMDLVFAPLELAALAAAAVVAALVAHDGRTTWLEGAMLVAVFALMALGFFWWPA